jgi:hypothetical protein
MANNTAYNELVGHTTGKSSGIVANPKDLADVMNNLSIRITKEVLKQIDGEPGGLSDTGNLRQSVQMPVKFFGTKFVATLYMADYYDFINKGVNGVMTVKSGTPYSFKDKKPPLLKEWSHRKGLNPFAVQQSMFKKGIRKRPFWDRAYKTISEGSIFDLLKKDLVSAGETATTEAIKQIFKKK